MIYGLSIPTAYFAEKAPARRERFFDEQRLLKARKGKSVSGTESISPQRLWIEGNRKIRRRKLLTSVKYAVFIFHNPASPLRGRIKIATRHDDMHA